MKTASKIRWPQNEDNLMYEIDLKKEEGLGLKMVSKQATLQTKTISEMKATSKKGNFIYKDNIKTEDNLKSEPQEMKRN